MPITERRTRSNDDLANRARQRRMLREMLGERRGRVRVGIVGWIAVLGLVACVGFAAAVHAQTPLPAVERVVADAQGGVITITGAYFTRPIAIKVNGASEDLRLVSLTDREVKAALPAHVRDGAYLLQVVHGTEKPQAIEVPFTVGPVGPALDERN